jgi:competence protein ComEC
MKKFRENLIIGVLVLTTIATFSWRELKAQGIERVVFCDVGQGDAALINLKNNAQIVIDGGPSTAVLSCLGKFMPFFDRKIEYLIISHPDKDHFLGAVEILKRYNVGSVITNGDESDIPEYEEFLRLAENKIIVADPQADMDFADSRIDFLYPTEAEANEKDSNAKSLLFKFIYNSKKILFTGDLPQEAEAKVLTRWIDVSADILKVGHHGSKTSSSADFLRMVNPRFAVVSVGADNKYGHPNNITLKRLENAGIKYLRTDETGDIVVNFR